MGRLIDFHDVARDRCCRYGARRARRMPTAGRVRIVAAFAAVGLAVFALLCVQRARAAQAVPAFFSMLFPQLIPQGMLEFFLDGAFGVMPL